MLFPSLPSSGKAASQSAAFSAETGSRGTTNEDDNDNDNENENDSDSDRHDHVYTERVGRGKSRSNPHDTLLHLPHTASEISLSSLLASNLLAPLHAPP